MQDPQLEKKARLVFLTGCLAALTVVIATAVAPDDDLVLLFVLFPMWCYWWVAAILSVAYIVELSRRRCWNLVVLLAILLASVSLALPDGGAWWLGTASRFAIMKPTYDDVIRAMPTNAGRIKAFYLSSEWDNALDEHIVYDDSGELGKPYRQRSLTWRERAKAQAKNVWGPGFEECAPVKPLWSHYYIVTTCFRLWRSP